MEQKTMVDRLNNILKQMPGRLKFLRVDDLAPLEIEFLYHFWHESKTKRELVNILDLTFGQIQIIAKDLAAYFDRDLCVQDPNQIIGDVKNIWYNRVLGTKTVWKK